MRSAKEDFPLYVVFFHEPNLKDGKTPEEFEKLCLEVMSQVNKSKPLSESEQKLIIARTKEVASNSKIKEFVIPSLNRVRLELNDASAGNSIDRILFPANMTLYVILYSSGIYNNYLLLMR
jgi:hypothetical protein